MSSSPGGIVYIKFDELTDLTSIKSGGYGLIYKASHARFGTVAYKEIKVESAESHEASLLQDEAKIHFGLNHENVVEMHGLIFEAPNFGLVLEFMDNGDLIEFIRKHKPGHETKLKLLSEVASGMRFLHEHTPPIIHGDLKGTNILISQDIHAKVNDFGFSRTKDFSQSTSIHNVRLGTVTHIPPENWENPYLRKTERFDVYGFGIMIWEVITGEKPYSEAQGNDAVISVWVQKGQRPNMSTFPEILQSLQLLMQRCWQQHPPMRPNFSNIGRKLEELASTEKEIIPKILKKEQPVIPTERNVKSSTAPSMTTGNILEPEIAITPNVIKGTYCAPSLSTDKLQTVTMETTSTPGGTHEAKSLSGETQGTIFQPDDKSVKLSKPGVPCEKSSSSGVTNETTIIQPDSRSEKFPKTGISCKKKSSSSVTHNASSETHGTISQPGDLIEKFSKLEVTCEKNSLSGVTNEKVETSFERGVSCEKIAESGVTRQMNSSTSGRKIWEEEQRWIPPGMKRNLKSSTTPNVTTGEILEPAVTSAMKSSSGVIIETKPDVTSENFPKPGVNCMKTSSGVQHETTSQPGFSSEKLPKLEVACEKKSSSGVTNHYENVETSLGGSVPYEHGVSRQKKSTSGSSYETIIPRRRVDRSDITNEEFIPVVVTRENISTSDCTSGMMFVPGVTCQIIQMNDISTSANKKTSVPKVSASASGFTRENIPNPEETVEKAIKKPLRRSVSTGSQTKSSASLQDQLDEQCWYFGDQTIYTKDLCADMLGTFIKKDGTYLVRKNKDGGPNQPYTLSIVYHREVIHARIHFMRPKNTYSLGADAAHHFESVPNLISYYQNNLLRLGEDILLKLGQTVPKLTE